MRSASVNAPGATGASAAIILDQHLTPQTVGLMVSLSAGASLTTKVQWSLSDPFATYATDYKTDGIWFDDKNLTGVTANEAGIPVCADGFPIPVRAVRLNNTGWVSGVATLTAVQCGGIS